MIGRRMLCGLKLRYLASVLVVSSYCVKYMVYRYR